MTADKILDATVAPKMTAPPLVAAIVAAVYGHPVIHDALFFDEEIAEIARLVEGALEPFKTVIPKPPNVDVIKASWFLFGGVVGVLITTVVELIRWAR